MNRAEKQFTGSIRCGHCQNVAPMEIVAIYEEEDYTNSYYDPEDIFTRILYDTHQLCKCPACSEITFRTGRWDDCEGYEGVEFTYHFPEQQKVPEGLPAKIKEDYEVALKVKRISANAYAVLIGRVLESVCEDRGANGKDLYSKLSSLATKGEIPTKLVDVAQRLRDLRNVGAHASLGELTESEVPVLDNLIKALLEYVYSAPHLVKVAEERLNKLKSKT